MTALRIAEDLELPLDLVTQKIALLARSGAGKTETAVDFVEELLEAQQQVVVLDPPGAWWGLRPAPTARSLAIQSSCSVGSTAIYRLNRRPANSLPTWWSTRAFRWS